MAPMTARPNQDVAPTRRGRQRLGPQNVAPEDELPLLIYRTSAPPFPAVVPATSTRGWIENTDSRFARRCLPLMIACQAGWFLVGTHSFTARWDGGNSTDSVKLNYTSGEPPYPALSHFGYGVLTFHVPFLFRTPPGWNLLARGPSNWPKDGAIALEGIVETDWSMATFTMNWKMTAVRRPVEFHAGEPFCMIVPQKRGDLERFMPKVLDIKVDAGTNRGFVAWRDARAKFLSELGVPGTEAHAQEWQKHYFRGTSPNGAEAPVHQTKLSLQPVDDDAGWSPDPDGLLGP